MILGSIGVNPGYILVNNKDCPQSADDYVRGFKVLRALPCDVFLASHSLFYGMPEKYAKLKDEGPESVYRPGGLQGVPGPSRKELPGEAGGATARGSEMAQRPPTCLPNSFELGR